MERTIKILIIFVLFFMPLAAIADDVSQINELITPRVVEFKTCTRSYILPADKLFYMAIASANANRFKVEEIQSKTGYILFTAAGKQYLASILKIDSTHTQLKITPTNNNYFFAPGIVLNFFRYIDLNGATPTVKLL